MTTKERDVTEEVRKHGENLKDIFRNCYHMDPFDLYQKVRAIEKDASTIGLRLCNDSTYSAETAKCDERDVMWELSRLLGFEENKGIGKSIFVNRDPRGYALKIEDAYVKKHDLKIHRDWGGYGILAPDFSE